MTRAFGKLRDKTVTVDAQSTSTVPETSAITTTTKDSIVKFYNGIDWIKVRGNCRTGVNNLGLIISSVGTVLNDFGTFLKEI